LRFSDFESIEIHGTAAPGTNQAQATRGLFATQKGIAASCRSPAGSGEATATERTGSIGVTFSLTPRFSEVVLAAPPRSCFKGFCSVLGNR
jgi:hypothetical protein